MSAVSVFRLKTSTYFLVSVMWPGVVGAVLLVGCLVGLLLVGAVLQMRTTGSWRMMQRAIFAAVDVAQCHLSNSSSSSSITLALSAAMCSHLACGDAQLFPIPPGAGCNMREHTLHVTVVVAAAAVEDVTTATSFVGQLPTIWRWLGWRDSTGWLARLPL